MIYITACKYAMEAVAARWGDGVSQYEDGVILKNHMNLVYEMKAIYQLIFNLTPNQFETMTFNQAYNYADFIFAEWFEKLIPNPVNEKPVLTAD